MDKKNKKAYVLGKYTDEDFNFIRENYPKYGALYCSIKLNRHVDNIMAKANREKIYCKEKQIHDSVRNVSFNQFENILSEKVAYFLGYFWADGHVINYSSKKITYWRVCLEIVEKDALYIHHLMNEIGKWSIQKRKRKESWQTTWSFVTNNKPLCEFLINNGYKDKSNCEPTKILELIPRTIHPYFWRGYFDGDGCCGLVGRGKYIEFSATYDYKWDELSKLCQSIGLTNYKIYKQISKRGHKSSIFKIYGKSTEPLAEYLLKTEIGLKRKTLKINEIITKKTKK